MNETPAQNSPDTPTDTARASGGTVRRVAIVGETRDGCPLPTRADTVRTPSDSEGPDTDPVVRFAHRTTAPRHLAGAAFAEALSRVTAKLHPEPEPALPKATRCCLCGDIGDYESHNGDLFCWPCVNGEPAPTDRRAQDAAATGYSDTPRTRPDTDTTDTRPGVRVEYRASVPHYLMGAALAEALQAVNRATSMDTHPDTLPAWGGIARTGTVLVGESTDCAPRLTSPDSARTTLDMVTLDMSGRRAEIRASIAKAFDLPPSILQKDPTP